jgi:DNA-binding NtrC family response regulator
MARILIIDDDLKICETLSLVMENLGHDAIYALQLKQGLHTCALEKFDIVFLDVRLPDGNGLEALPDIQKTVGLPEVLIITGEGDPDGAEMAIRSGAWDYIEKPLSLESITLPLRRALQYHEEKQTKVTLEKLNRSGIIGDSPQILKCLNHLAQASSGEANTLVIGETGTGKELFAKAIHQNSPRKGSNFIVVDCAALPENLVESILFGHKKGAFTGAEKDREGLVGMADKGTLFLDEVGELPLATQRTFLRVLQEKKYRRVGGKREKNSDFRLEFRQFMNLLNINTLLYHIIT